MTVKRFLGTTDHDTELAQSEIVILPVPFDLTSTWQKGADKGPDAIIAASPNLEFYNIETDSEVYRRGIYTEEPIVAGTPVEMIKKVQRQATDHLGHGRLVVTLGGEHSVSIGAVKAYSDQYRDLTVIQLDAHSDLRDEYNGSRYNHACVMARISEMCPIVQVGIRSMDVTEKKKIESGRIFYAHEIHNSQNWIDSAVKLAGNNVYVTIDLDVFDSGIMPSTGTPEPGGLGWYEVVHLLKRLTETTNVVGFDVVELCPSAFNKAPDFLAAKLIYTFLSYIRS